MGRYWVLKLSITSTFSFFRPLSWVMYCNVYYRSYPKISNVAYIQVILFFSTFVLINVHACICKYSTYVNYFRVINFFLNKRKTAKK